MTNKLDRLMARVLILESLGFEIEHGDSRVTHPALFDVKFGFSATDDRMFIHQALKTVQSVAFAKGRNSLRAEFAALMETE